MNQTEARRMAEKALTYQEIVDLIETHATYNIAGWKLCGIDQITRYTQKAIAAALMQLTQGQEPVEYQLLVLGSRWAHCSKQLYEKSQDRSVVRALYTHPIPSQQEERKPLKREQLLEMARHNYWHNSRTTLAAYLEGARDAEAAHNIKEQPK